MNSTHENTVKKPLQSADLSLSEFRYLLEEYKLSISEDAVLSPILKVKPHADREKLVSMGLLEKDSGWPDALIAISTPDFQINSVLTSSHTRIKSWKYANRSNSDILVECWQEGEQIHISFPVEYHDIGVNDFIALDIDNAPSPYVGEKQFTPDGFLAFAAVVDILRVVMLSSVLQRQVIKDFILPVDKLNTIIELSVQDENFDARWMVTLLRMFAPEACIPSRMKILKKGLKELIKLKLIKEEEDNHWSPSEELLNIASQWITPLPAIHHEIIITHLDGSKDIKNSLTLRGNGPLTLVDFEYSNDKEVKILFRPMKATVYWLEMTGRMIPPEIDEKYKIKEPLPPKKRVELKCDKCGISLFPGQKFCNECGAPVLKGEAPRTPQKLKPKVAKCPACGTELVPGSKFCTHCGAPVTKGETPPTSREAKPEVGKCPVCGAELLPGAMFCTHCGAEIPDELQ